MTALRRDADLLRRSRNCVENDKNVTVRQSELRMKQCYQQIEELASAKMQCQEELAAVKEEVHSLLGQFFFFFFDFLLTKSPFFVKIVRF